MDAATKAMPLLTLLNGLSNFHKKKYCYPSQKKILDLLATRQGIKISIATLNRRLLSTEKAGYLRRIRRIRRDPKKGIIFQSTVYVIKHMGYMLLCKLGVPCWQIIKKIASYRNGKKRKSYNNSHPQPIKHKGVNFKNFKERHPAIKTPLNSH